MREAVIVSAVRTAVGKASKGTLRSTRPDDLAALAIREALARAKGLDPREVEDVILGCAMPEAEQGMNLARIASLRAGLPVEASAMTINRFCSSGLQAIAIAAERIMAGQGDVAVAGGAESMSMIPMGGNKVSPNPWLMDNYPDAYLGMGLTAENLAKKYGITRQQADEFSLASHQKAVAAIAGGKFKDEIVPVEVSYTALEASAASGFGSSSAIASAAKPKTVKLTFDTDEGPRSDTSLEALAKLKPAFHARGVVTAGNSSQMSDGAAAAVVMSAERARSLGLKPLARFLAFATAGCLPEEMGIGPVYAIPKALKIAGLTLDRIDVIELNEAFAAQALSVMKLLNLDPARVNVNGGAIALGHPLGCTGAKLTATILRELDRRNARYGLVTMCVGGGMGAAGIFERAA
ncbi:MAG: acetyl-CoA C-acyltransferase [Candidatus Acidiferrales bacterium]